MSPLWKEFGNTMIQVISTEDKQSRIVKIEGTCDVRVAQDLLAALQEVCSDGLPATVDCSGVESIDTACIQLLLAAMRDSSSSFEIQYGESESLRWIELAGVAEYLTSTEPKVVEKTPANSTCYS